MFLMLSPSFSLFRNCTSPFLVSWIMNCIYQLAETKKKRKKKVADLNSSIWLKNFLGTTNWLPPSLTSSHAHCPPLLTSFLSLTSFHSRTSHSTPLLLFSSLTPQQNRATKQRTLFPPLSTFFFFFTH